MKLDFGMLDEESAEIRKLEAKIDAIRHSQERRNRVLEMVMDNRETPDIDSKAKVIIAIQLALGDNVDDCPNLIPDLRDRLLSRIKELKARASSQDGRDL